MKDPDIIESLLSPSVIDVSEIRWSEEDAYYYARLMSYYRCAMMEVETKFNVLNEEFSLQFDRQPISSIKSRLKSPASIQGKRAR